MGVDVGAKLEIYKVFETLIKEGKTIIIVSSYLPEVMGLSDRMLVMYEGKQMGILNKDEYQDERILLSCFKDKGKGEGGMSVAKSNSENKKGVSLFKNGLKTEMLLVGILVYFIHFLQRYSAGFLKTDTLMKLLKQASIYGTLQSEWYSSLLLPELIFP